MIEAPIILILTIVMPGQLPDRHKELGMPTIEECLSQERIWLNRGLTPAMKEHGVVAVKAACQVKDGPEL